MESKLNTIQAQLYRSETSFPPLRDLLLHSGELKAWFKYYNGLNQWAKRFFTEEHVYLTNRVIIVARIEQEGKLFLNSFRLEEISRIQREYDFEDRTQQKLILSCATITFKRTIEKKKPDILLYKRPLPSEQGDPIGYEKFMALLD